MSGTGGIAGIKRLRRVDDPHPDCLDHRMATRGGAKFVTNVGEVETHRRFRAVQYLSDIPGAFSCCTPFKAFKFTTREGGRLFMRKSGLDKLKRCFENEIPEAR